ncbi:hypothetical protein [Pseudooceanicola sp.]|uniref:hypothetical protein n=1 Tax=Pseudooceanicola sp. TaxID=1914328 RepID=UPI00262A7E4F|nr:hypothetical protein [Pseudooceanicola sp.]MDF1855462.1 hypothetical protein [Pseudooceanicola sp.]
MAAGTDPVLSLPELKADCSACAALCCVGLAFDRGNSFAIDKPAGQACPNLAGHACRIHDKLGDQGFSGCAAYDCVGAGQRTLALYSGISWQDDPTRLAPMLDTFAHLRRLHELIALLDTAAGLTLPASVEARRLALLTQICPETMTPAEADSLATGPLPGAVRDFLRGLRDHLAPQ